MRAARVGRLHRTLPAHEKLNGPSRRRREGAGRSHHDLVNDRQLLKRLREEGLRFAPEVTWNAAGARLLQTYVEVVESKRINRGQTEVLESA